MEKTRVSVTAPDALKEGLRFNGTALAAAQIVGVLRSLPYHKRRAAVEQALATLKAANESLTIREWCQGT